MASAPIFNARRPKLPCDYETIMFFADTFKKIGEELSKQAQEHEAELKGDYPEATGVRIYDSLYNEYYWPVRNLSDFMSIAYKQYSDYTGHE